MYDWIETTFNVSGGVTQVIAVILALLAVLLLFSLFVFILKRLMGNNMPQSRNRQPRIAVMDSATVDSRRRLVLIRRDNVEHLILVGGPSDVVVEQNIIKNAPLSGGRAAPSAPQANTQVKAPIAPGPDIPLRPEEPAAPPQPVLQKPMAPPADPAPAGADLSAGGRPVARTFNSRADDIAAPSPPSPVPPAPKAAPEPATAPIPNKGPNRASDLLKAAARNGFSRTGGKAATPEPGPEAETQASPVSPPPSAEVATPVKAEPAKPVSEKSASRFGSLTRPFKTRERPSYGTQKITPPASGPAARAKTALFAPVDKAKEATKAEPVLDAATPAPATAEPVKAEDAPSVRIDQDAVPPETPGDTAKTEPDTATKPAPLVKDAETETGEVGSPPKQVDASEEAVAVTTGQADEIAKDKDAPRELNLNLEVENLIFEEDPEQSETSPSSEAASKPASPAANGPKAGENAPDTAEASTKSPEVRISTSAPTGTAPEVKAPEVKPVGGQQTKAQQKLSTSLAEKNPIEDEMAKILDELGGQPN